MITHFFKRRVRRRKNLGSQGRRARQFEALERRELMAGLQLSGGVLNVTADPRGSEVEIHSMGPGYVVRDVTADTLRWFSDGQVNSVVFNGSDQPDRFTNHSNLPDKVFGRGGNDVLQGGSGYSYMEGGHGNDVLRGGSGNDVLYGSPGSDSIFGGPGNDRIDAGRGRDNVWGDDGHDRIWGGPDSARDIIFGGAGNDTVWGGGGDDIVFGNDGNDVLYGEDGDDQLAGERGDDRLYGGNQNDTLYGGYAPEIAKEVMPLGTEFAWAARTSFFLGAGRDNADGRDFLFGEAGNDWLFGGTGRNYVHGGTGDDGIFSLKADDEDFYGGVGADRFLLHKETSGDIHDFEQQDAKIRFVDSSGQGLGYGSSRWSPEEVHRVDKALAGIQAVAGTASILEKADGGTVTFVRRGQQVATNVDGVAFNSGGTIILTNQNFTEGENWLTEVVAHETGHNWDNENRDWRGFRALSGWTSDNPNSSQYLRGTDEDHGWWYLQVTRNDFVSDYARTNPYEDFADTFAAVFMDRLGLPFGHGIGVDAAPAKAAFVERFLTSLAYGDDIGVLSIA